MREGTNRGPLIAALPPAAPRRHAGNETDPALVLARYAMARNVQLKINWWGRWGVWPVFSALFFALCGVHWLALACLYVGLVLTLGATVQYVRDGLAQARLQGST